MNILEKIIAHKKEEVAKRKARRSIGDLKTSVYYKRKTLSLQHFLLDDTKTGVIAEFKRKSPSKGVINSDADVVKVTKAYTAHGASCLSVLTDEEFFGGKDVDILAARINAIPILRKDFIIDEYQIAEAKALGADVILLIAACMTPERVRELAVFARTLQLEVLLEIHDDNELQHICNEVHLVGVNNRNLKTFAVDINTSIELGRKIPADKIKIAESGISNFETIDLLRHHGFRGFLIGEHFMKTPDPGLAFEQFVKHLKL
jgi:indole-3-glycerol phosphate synthase